MIPPSTIENILELLPRTIARAQEGAFCQAPDGTIFDIPLTIIYRLFVIANDSNFAAGYVFYAADPPHGELHIESASSAHQALAKLYEWVKTNEEIK